MKRLMIAALLALAACSDEPLLTAEGCPVGIHPIRQAAQYACQAAYREEAARAAGGSVTRCTNTGGGMSCITY